LEAPKQKKIYKYNDKRNAIHSPKGSPPRIDKRNAKNNVEGTPRKFNSSKYFLLYHIVLSILS